MDTTTKQWSTWTTGPKGKKTPKRHSEQNMLECTLELPELFTLYRTNIHPVNATVITDTQSTIVKKALDEESRKLSAMGREQIKNTRKKLGPLEEKMTSKVKAAGKVHRQQKEHHHNNAGDGRRNNNKEGENTNMG